MTTEDARGVQWTETKSKPSADGIVANEFLTEEDLAKEVKRSVRTIRRWNSLKLGPPRVVIGNLILFRRESVLEWLRSREDGATRGRKRASRGLKRY